MYRQQIWAVVTLAATFASASPVRTSPTVNDDISAAIPQGEPSWSRTRCAELPLGVMPNDTSSIEWEDCEEHEARLAKRAIICDRATAAGCSPTCSVSYKEDVYENGSGTWWTAPCHVGGLHTQDWGSLATVSIGHSTTVKWSFEVGFAGTVGDFLDGKLGYSIEQSKNINQGLGCENHDGQPHAVWIQEQLGWADTTVVATGVYRGQGCDPPGTHTYVSQHRVHADYPDPYGRGFRDLKAICSYPDNGDGPWCNLDATTLQ